MYLRNCWYAAAWSRDIEPNKPFARTICEEPVVIFKTESGQLVALEDRCVHRRAPLSLGRIKGETIECGYHGLQYDCSGRCVRIPGQQDIPERARVRAYPLADKWRWLWIWLGNPEMADESLIPDVHWNDSPGWVSPGDTLHMNGHYQLLIDNLLDLSHLTFLHERTIGTSMVAETPMKAEAAGDRVRVTRWIIDQEAPPMFKKAGGFTENVDRWQIIEWTPPGLVLIDVGCAPHGTGAPEGDRSQGIEARSINLITPETAKTHHYLWSYARNYNIENIELTEFLLRAVGETFLEDKEMLEGQQARAESDDRQDWTIDLKVDSGPMQARRILERLIGEELGAVASAAE
ncbi:MAG: aromatic ring-hydroxylating dioxygenase subunit alpha [Rhodospirillales bacterium]|jgi:phenylpropionate dioxygenase-like ring-hydroxylating dioxygenase large terminal subunit|nr:aromatic ring-hydroxylating dioxygenase subunit alpha [Rhodospirillales bacterium]MDP6774313.1 aromatic ring-hydroxylating dioxygenase subunit alpha [Rhodospirillales bacterium]